MRTFFSLAVLDLQGVGVEPKIYAVQAVGTHAAPVLDAIMTLAAYWRPGGDAR
jgi:hypothetical protein